MIKCAIFDLDGTMVDSMPYWEKTPIEYVRRNNFDATNGLSKKFLSMNLPEGAKFLIDTFKINKTVEEVSLELDSIMENYYMNYVELKPNFVKVLDLFKKHNVHMAIASSTDKHLIEKVIKKLGIDSYFEFITTSTEIGKSKKHPDIYLKCCKHFNISPSDSIIFEDLPYGIVATKDLGFTRIGLFDLTSIFLQDEIKNASDFYFEAINDKDLMILESLLEK